MGNFNSLHQFLMAENAKLMDGLRKNFAKKNAEAEAKEEERMAKAAEEAETRKNRLWWGR